MKNKQKTVFAEKYFQFAELLNYGIMKLNRLGEVEEINMAALDMLGVGKDTVLAKLPPSLHEEWLEYRRSDIFYCGKGIVEPDQDAYKLLEIFFNKIDNHNYILLMRSFPIESEPDAEKIQDLLDELGKQVQKIQETRSYLLEEIEEHHNFTEIVSKNEAYKSMLNRLVEVAETDASVLIEGETGTGKELLARAIHNLSSRRIHPLIKVNCATITDTLFESELFGHEEGAFPGALFRRIGKFELADESTLFLDEVGDLSLDMQSKLLKVLEEGTFERMGNVQEIKTNVRIVASSNKPLKKMIEEGTFRKDLYYRLNVFPIQSPPLRQRRDDIPLLIQHFTKKYSNKAGKNIKHIPKEQVAFLSLYDFPGNVRELENLIERAVILSKDQTLNLNAILSDIQHKNLDQVTDEFRTFEQMQYDHIIAALEKTRWKVSGKNSASQLLKLNSKTLVSKMKKLGIRREDFK